jgi:hypothetical protein
MEFLMLVHFRLVSGQTGYGRPGQQSGAPLERTTMVTHRRANPDMEKGLGRYEKVQLHETAASPKPWSVRGSRAVN